MTTNEISSNINVSNKIEYKISVIYFDKELMPIRKIYRSFFIEKIPNMFEDKILPILDEEEGKFFPNHAVAAFIEGQGNKFALVIPDQKLLQIVRFRMNE